MKKEVNLSILPLEEDKEMKKLFHTKIQVKKTKIDALFYYGLHENLIVEDMVRMLGLEVHDHPSPLPLGWVNKDLKLRVMKYCKIKFSISAEHVD